MTTTLKTPTTWLAGTTIMAAGLAHAVFTTPSLASNGFQLCHIENAGFYAESDGQGILIDGMIREGLDGFAKASPELTDNIQAANAPFANLSIGFITHKHTDHFDAEATLEHLDKNAKVHYVVSEEIASELKSAGMTDEQSSRLHAVWPGDNSSTPIHLDLDNGIQVDIYRVSHNMDIQNLGYHITMPGGTTLFHPGDIQASEEELKSAGLKGVKVEYLLMPFFYGATDPADMERIKMAFDYTYIVPTHFHEGEPAWAQKHGGMAAFKASAIESMGGLNLADEMACLNNHKSSDNWSFK